MFTSISVFVIKQDESSCVVTVYLVKPSEMSDIRNVCACVHAFVRKIPFSLFHFCALGLHHSLLAVKNGVFMFVCFYLNSQ